MRGARPLAIKKTVSVALRFASESIKVRIRLEGFGTALSVKILSFRVIRVLSAIRESSAYSFSAFPKISFQTFSPWEKLQSGSKVYPYCFRNNFYDNFQPDKKFRAEQFR